MNKKLYVGNLPFTVEEAQLQAIFSAEGRKVTSIKILIDKLTGRSRGFAFVEMATSDDAAKAMDAVNGKDFMGRPLTVTEAREQSPRDSSGGGAFTDRQGRSHGGGRRGGGRPD